MKPSKGLAVPVRSTKLGLIAEPVFSKYKNTPPYESSPETRSKSPSPSMSTRVGAEK
jgi:hypothetical protein